MPISFGVGQIKSLCRIVLDMYPRPRDCTRSLASGLPRLSDAVSDFILQSELTTTYAQKNQLMAACQAGSQNPVVLTNRLIRACQAPFTEGLLQWHVQLI